MAFQIKRCNHGTTPPTHIDYAHYGDLDICLCGWDTRVCTGDCGLEDMSYLPCTPDSKTAPPHWKNYVPN